MFLRILFVLLVVSGSLFFASCESPSRDESNLPWSRPASWEGQAPGMGHLAPGRDSY